MSTEKNGEVKKCPACGAFVDSFQTKCAECGHEFSGVASVGSASKLFELLNAADMRKSRELSAHNIEKNQRLDDLSKRHNAPDSVIGKIFTNTEARKEREDEEPLILEYVLEGDEDFLEEIIDDDEYDEIYNIYFGGDYES